ncbi:hypothetical protein RJT34_29673 [Clitoria ternatea]|uniref:Uncharacterized protein n=1 Tax=Clitoria ternatea TaxID=43366 RepID=A0AAN9EYM0_CLITE
MKKLYRKGTVHPSPPTISDHLSFLPAAILTLTLSLSPQDREVLAYLIAANPRRKEVVDGDHPPLFNCTCFRCYMSYWVRWNSSPNHQLIHQIIDSFEDSLAQPSKPHSNKNNRRNKRTSNNSKPSHLLASSPPSLSESQPESGGGNGGEVEAEQGGDGVEDEEKGSVRRFVSFIGERIWGAWAQ